MKTDEGWAERLLATFLVLYALLVCFALGVIARWILNIALWIMLH